MRRALGGLAAAPFVAALALTMTLALAPGGASAQELAPPTVEGDTEPDATFEMGARLGAQFGLTDSSPGGLRLGGDFLYRFDERAWFDTDVGFTFGGNSAQCFENRAGETECDRGIADGFSFQVLAGVRYNLAPRPGRFLPYVRGGVSLQIARFGDDELTGAAFPLWLGAGGRFLVAERVSVGGDVTLLYGPSFFTRGLGLEPYGAVLTQLTVELAL